MLLGTLYLFGRAHAMRPEDDTEVIVEILAIDTQTDYEDYVKIDGSLIESGTLPDWARDAYRAALHGRTQVDKEVAREWLAN